MQSRRNLITKLLLCFALLAVAPLGACKKPKPAEIPPYTGSWQGALQDGTVLSFALEQQGNSITGTVNIVGIGSSPVVGSIVGDKVFFAFSDEGLSKFTFGGALANDVMKGRWEQKYTEHAGTWTASRTSTSPGG